MPQKPIELILMRQLASTLAVPIFLVDAVGTLAFFNEPAERVLGRRFEETGEMPLDEWSTVWVLSEIDGSQLKPERAPLRIAVTERRPERGEYWLRGLDGASRRIEVTAFPLVRGADQVLGAVALFWETSS